MRHPDGAVPRDDQIAILQHQILVTRTQSGDSHNLHGCFFSATKMHRVAWLLFVLLLKSLLLSLLATPLLMQKMLASACRQENSAALIDGSDTRALDMHYSHGEGESAALLV